MATVKAQADTIGVSPESIMRSKAFRHGVNDVRNGKRPRFDAAWGNDECEWEYEWGRAVWSAGTASSASRLGGATQSGGCGVFLSDARRGYLLMTPRPKPNKESLTQIASKLFALVKGDVKSAIEKGRLLQRACEQHEGEYGDWLEKIGWAETSAKRYRAIYTFSQTNPQIGGLIFQ